MKFGARGLPLTESKSFPGEWCLHCPACNSSDLTLGIAPGPFGTGPGGRWRMGDAGGKEYAHCCNCGRRYFDPPRERREDEEPATWLEYVIARAVKFNVVKPVTVPPKEA